MTSEQSRPSAHCSRPGKCGENGIIIILTAFLLVPLLTLIAITVTVSEWSTQQAALQMAADTAAHDATTTLCSRRICWNHALINALEAVRSQALRGNTSRAAFQQAIGQAISDLQVQLNNPATVYLDGPNGKNEWNLDGITVRIERGRWWPQAQVKNTTNTWEQKIPSSISLSDLYPQQPIFSYSNMVFVDPRFEAFDRFSGTPWQSDGRNKGTPNFIASNAVRVVIEQTGLGMDFFYGQRSQGTYRAEAISSRARERARLDFCAAPFGIPVCSLLDDNGEYNPEMACQFDRFFGDPHRYCTVAQLQNGTCDVLPGSWYSPVTPGVSCQSDKPWYREQRCKCAQAAAEPCDINGSQSCPPTWVQGEGENVNFRDRFGQTCGQVLGQDSMECDFFPWPKLDQAADHYGVIGASAQQNYSAWYDPQGEQLYRWIFNGNCVLGGGEAQRSTAQMALGDVFTIKSSALQELATDESLWQATSPVSLWYSSTADLDRFNPRMYDSFNKQFGPNGFTELGYPWYVGRVNDRTGFPYGLTKKFLDQVIAAGFLTPYGTYRKLTCPVNGQPSDVDVSACSADPDNCQFVPGSCWVVPWTGEVEYASCIVDTANCPVDPNTCNTGPVACQISPSTCKVDPASCTTDPSTCKILPGTCQVDPATCKVNNDPCTSKPQVEPWACNKAGVKQWGTCNSHRVFYDSRCQRRFRWYVPFQTQADCDPYFPFNAVDGGLYEDYWPVGECQPHHNATTVLAKLFARGYVQNSAWWGADWQYTLDSSDPDVANPARWNCDETFPYLPCPWQHAAGAHASRGINPYQPSDIRAGNDAARVDRDSAGLTIDYHPANTRVLHVRMPVIADVSPNAKPCTGMGGSNAPDPYIDTTPGVQEWRIIGFIRGFVYDQDIGYPPAHPPDPGPPATHDPVWNWSFDKLTQTIVGNPPIRWEPAVCDYDNADRQPWAFNPTYEPPPPNNPSGPPVNAGTPTACNIVRGRVACEPGVIAGDYQGAFVEPEVAPAIVFAR